MAPHDFFDRLYLGFEAEHYIMGQLYSAGFEAFKMPADFGFDLMVTNQKELSFKLTPHKRAIDLPYALQIKSRRIKKEDFVTGPNGRQEADINFFISAKDINLIIDTPNAFLVCVLFFPIEQNKIQKRAVYFWFSSIHLKILNSSGYIHPADELNFQKDYYYFTSCIRLFPMRKTITLLQSLLQKNQITEEGQKKLEKALPEEIPEKFDASEYLSLKRPAKNKEEKSVTRLIPHQLTTLEKLGMNISITSLD